MSRPKLIEDPDGMVFEYIDEEEAEFLYEEVFVRRSYLQHGLLVEDSAVVVDAGANIGLFSLQCLREAKAVQVYAFEPIPAIYGVLTRNLCGSIDTGTGASPRPVALRVALGAHQGEEVFTFFSRSPGESTRHPEERGQQQRTLLEDTDAASWRRTLEKDSGALQETIWIPPPEAHDALACPADTQSREKEEDGSRRIKGGQEIAEAVARRTPSNDATDEEGNGCRSLGPATGGVTSLVRGKQASRNVCHTQKQDEEETGMGEEGEEVGEGDMRDREEEDGQRLGEASFVCNVVPLSLALDNLGVRVVDLLKVDVEGDELAVLRGISADDWSKIRQVVLEVHDIDGRLTAVVELLKSEPAGFDNICWELQGTSEVKGYVMVVPEALKMFLVFAKRTSKSLVQGVALPTAVAANDGKSGVLGGEAATVVGSKSVLAAGKVGSGRGDHSMVSRFCCCGVGGLSGPR